MRYLACVIVLCSASPAPAGFMDQMRAHDAIGYARAAVAACPKLKINPKGILAILAKLSAEDQASVGFSKMVTAVAEAGSAKVFALLGASSCDAALDYERKLGVDMFTE